MTINPAMHLFPKFHAHLFLISMILCTVAGEVRSEEAPLVLKAKLVEKTPVPSVEDIAPYDEALVLYEWKVVSIDSGALDAGRIGVYHWGFFDAIPQDLGSWRVGRTRDLTLGSWAARRDLHSVYKVEPDDPDLDLPVFMDEGQTIRRGNPDRGRRYDYGGRGGVSDRMTDVIHLRHVLKMVAFGDSRAKAGIMPQCFYAEEIERSPVAYNMAYDSTGISSLEELTREYLVRLPELECVIWNFSPRMLNKKWHEREIKIKGSPGNTYDRAHADDLWDAPDQAFRLRPEQIDWQSAPFGWEPRESRTLGGKFPKVENPEGFTFDSKDWGRLKDVAHLLAERGIHFIIFTPPIAIHPARGAVDNDGTPRAEHMRDLRRLRELADAYPTVHFYDIHRSGGHDFQREHFRNTDHVNAAGAEKLSRMLETYRARIMERHRRLVEAYGDGEFPRLQQLKKAVREAEPELAILAVSRLVARKDATGFPSLLERYRSVAGNEEARGLRDALREGMLDMAPHLRPADLAPLPGILRRDGNLKFPALVEVLAAALPNPESIKKAFGEDTLSMLSDYVSRAYDSARGEGDDARIMALPLAVAEAVGMELYRVRVNFQTPDAPVPEGFVADTGLTKQSRGGRVFGWDRDNTREARNRSRAHSDPRYATINHFRNGAWRMELPNGDYLITLVTGDPKHTGQRSHLLVNDTRLRDTSATNAYFMRHRFPLTVEGGELVIKPDDDADNAKIAYVVIEGFPRGD